jgi:hypothetical protein
MTNQNGIDHQVMEVSPSAAAKVIAQNEAKIRKFLKVPVA